MGLSACCPQIRPNLREFDEFTHHTHRTAAAQPREGPPRPPKRMAWCPTWLGLGGYPHLSRASLWRGCRSRTAGLNIWGGVVYCVSCRTQNHRLTTYTRRAHRLTKDPPARHTHALKNESRACERRLLHAVRPGSEAGGGKRSGHALETAARQTALRGQILMKMEASASSAISTEEKEPPTAWQRTVATLVQQLQADGDHLCG